VTIVAAANIIAPPIQIPTRASAATAVHKVVIRCTQGPVLFCPGPSPKL
jgi:hypothetical protein